MFNAHSPYMVCAINPKGVDGPSCPDYRSGTSTAQDQPLDWFEPWQPENASYYGDELVLSPVNRLTMRQRLELLNTHPLFTGRCPNCEQTLHQTDPLRIHWDCQHCGWTDDSV
jgi:hypothetical protein